MNIGVFIDLNTYKLTKSMLCATLSVINKDYSIDTLIYYNYSTQLHRDLDIDISSALPVVSGRRKVLIDMRQVCDVVEYASKTTNSNVFLISGLLDTAAIFDKLHSLNTRIILGVMQESVTNADEYIMLSRVLPLEVSKSKSRTKGNAIAETAANAPKIAPKTTETVIIPSNNQELCQHVTNDTLKNLLTNSVTLTHVPTAPTDQIGSMDTVDYDTKLFELDKIINRLYLKRE